MKPHIKEVIVVEGSHDSAHLKKYFDCETIVTGGLGIDERVMERIKEAAKENGIIVFTDPDGPGKMIRAKIEAEVPSCMHAFVMKAEARTTHKVGVEHASYEVLAEALKHASVIEQPSEETISAAVFYELGLAGQSGSEEKRRIVSKAFHVGEGYAKYLRKMLNRKGITAEQVKEILQKNG